MYKVFPRICLMTIAHNTICIGCPCMYKVFPAKANNTTCTGCPCTRFDPRISLMAIAHNTTCTGCPCTRFSLHRKNESVYCTLNCPNMHTKTKTVCVLGQKTLLFLQCRICLMAIAHNTTCTGYPCTRFSL